MLPRLDSLSVAPRFLVHLFCARVCICVHDISVPQLTSPHLSSSALHRVSIFIYFPNCGHPIQRITSERVYAMLP